MERYVDIFYVTYPFMGKLWAKKYCRHASYGQKNIAGTQEKKLIKSLRKYRKQQAAIIKCEVTAEQYLLTKNAAKRKNIMLGEAKKFYRENHFSEGREAPVRFLSD